MDDPLRFPLSDPNGKKSTAVLRLRIRSDYHGIMYQFVYVSSAVSPFTDELLNALLDVSRRRNSACNVTGLLLYANGNFIQLLEGEHVDVLATRARIEADQRHRGMVVLLEGPCAQRDFADWSMAFRKVDGPEAEKLLGFSTFFAQKADPAAQRSAAVRMLEFFKELNS
jgi:hypothetical protein